MTTTLNVGLSVLGSHKIYSMAEALGVLAYVGVSPISVTAVGGGFEPTLVAALDSPLTAYQAELICSLLRQEAVAQWSPDAGGEILGPDAAKWEPFNPDYFKQLSDNNRLTG